MNLHCFVSIILLIIMYFRQNESSALSKYYNYDPEQEPYLDITDGPYYLRQLKRLKPRLYEDLMEEQPHLKKILQMRRKNKTLNTFYFPPKLIPEGLEDEYDPEIAYAHGMERKVNNLMKKMLTKRHSTWDKVFRTLRANNYTRRWIYNKHQQALLSSIETIRYDGQYKISCYECGSQWWIPRSKICHDMFDSPDGKARTLTRFFRSRCYYNPFNWDIYTMKNWWTMSDHQDILAKPPEPEPDYDIFLDPKKIIESLLSPYPDVRFLRDRSNPWYKYYHGYVTAGCVKRFLDIGSVYTQRFCKSWPPAWPNSNDYTGYQNRYTTNYARHRFRKLEMTLGKWSTKDRCVSSPAASLTPFSRSISLFARYHVCACFGKSYCNSAATQGPKTLLILLLLFICRLTFNFE